MVKREITNRTENTLLYTIKNTIIYVLLHKNDFNILNLSDITSGLTMHVKTVLFNLKTTLNLIRFFEHLKPVQIKLLHVIHQQVQHFDFALLFEVH